MGGRSPPGRRSTSWGSTAPPPPPWFSRTSRSRWPTSWARWARATSIAFNVLDIGRHKLAAACIGRGQGGPAPRRSSTPRARGSSSTSPSARLRDDPGKAGRHVHQDLHVGINHLPDRGPDSTRPWRPSIPEDPERDLKAVKAIEEYTIECCANKVYGSEVIDFIVDEWVQILGGYGYSCRVSGRAGLPRRPDQPDLRGDQRGQPAPGPGDDHETGHEESTPPDGQAAQALGLGGDDLLPPDGRDPGGTPGLPAAT